MIRLLVLTAVVFIVLLSALGTFSPLAPQDNSAAPDIQLRPRQVHAQASETPVPQSSEPSVNFHALRGNAKTGQAIDISVSVGNTEPNLDIKATVVVLAPTGISLSGDSCASPGLCTAVYDLPSGQHRTMQLTATANQAGGYVLVADVTWRSGVGGSSILSRSLELSFTDPAEGETDVIFHADRTEVELGQSVRLTLTAANSIVKPPMTLKLILRTPSGWSLRGSGFASSCAGQCVATYDVAKGEQRTIDLELVPNQVGSANIEARLEWYFGNDELTLEKRVELLELNVNDEALDAGEDDSADTGGSTGSPDWEFVMPPGVVIDSNNIIGFGIGFGGTGGVLAGLLIYAVLADKRDRRIGMIRSLRADYVGGQVLLTWDPPAAKNSDKVVGYRIEHFRWQAAGGDDPDPADGDYRLEKTTEIANFPTEYEDDDPTTGVLDYYTVTPFVAEGGPYGVKASTRSIRK